jgi:hypothetical protein
MYTIINKATKEFFAGFDSNDMPVFTKYEDSAWSIESIYHAEAQAIALARMDRNVQKKLVRV